ncbi:MAG: 23S rRNA (pseudouridine(1915)-N(3))-methyltransferase RlmH [Clostridiales bacterium]|nr:MAG: 23S rRNA (pseudouridine(1915)-N(3))-methyltransferase RlmH [Clostridiales bacterium]
MEVNLVCVGTLKEKYLREAADEYKKRLSRFCKLNIIELAESEPKKEKALINKTLRGFVIALCVEGKKYTSEQFTEVVEKTSLKNSKITFVIGSSEGLDEEIKRAADLQLSFSDMTFPHQLMRIIFLEQLYRVFTIMNNIKYHK